MGGHGGLNILPQKSWHVYNYEAREKVRRDEEAHAAAEQEQKDKQLQVEGELRRTKLLEKAKKRKRTEDDTEDGPALLSSASAVPKNDALQAAKPQEHINLFEGSDLPEVVKKGTRAGVGSLKAEAEGAAEDAKHRLGYGCVSGADGVEKPWYLKKSGLPKEGGGGSKEKVSGEAHKDVKTPPAKNGKKSIEQLRAERVGRENAEKERQRRLMLGSSTIGSQVPSHSRGLASDSGVKQRYNSAFGYGR